MPSPGKREAENDENRQTNDASTSIKKEGNPSSALANLAAPHPNKKSRKVDNDGNSNSSSGNYDNSPSTSPAISSRLAGEGDSNSPGEESPSGNLNDVAGVGHLPKTGEKKRNSSGRKGSEKVVRKDPRAPKRSKSAYIFFAMESREALKSEMGPKARVGDIAKATSLKWKALSDEERQKWEKKAANDRERYQQEKSEYSGPLLITQHADGKQESTKKQRDPRQPKRPLTAFLYYCQAHRPAMKEEHPDWGVAELSKELGREWRDMTAEEKKPYVKHEEEERKRYQHVNAEYKKLKEEEKEKEAVEKAKEELIRAKKEEEEKEAARRKEEKEKKKQQKKEEKKERQRIKAEGEAPGYGAPPSPVRSRLNAHDGNKRHEAPNGEVEREPSTAAVTSPLKSRGTHNRPQDHRSPADAGRVRTGRVDGSFQHFPASARRAQNEEHRRITGAMGSPMRSHRYPTTHPHSARRGESYPYDGYGGAPQPPSGAGGVPGVPYHGGPGNPNFERDRDISERDREYYKMYPHYGQGGHPPSPPPSSHYGYYPPGGPAGYPSYPPYGGGPPGMGEYYAPPPSRPVRPSSRGAGEGPEDMRSAPTLRPSASTEEEYGRGKYNSRAPQGYPSPYPQPPPGYPGAEYSHYPYGDPYYGAPTGHEGGPPPPGYGGEGGYYGNGAPPPSQAGYPPPSDPYYNGYHPQDYPPPNSDYSYPPPPGYEGGAGGGPTSTSPPAVYGGDPSLPAPSDPYYGSGRSGGDGYAPPSSGYGPPPGGGYSGY